MISLEEFNNLPEEEKKNVLQTLKTESGIKEIIETWGISRSKLYSMQNKLGIPNEARNPRKSRDKKIKVTKSRNPRNPRSEKTDSVESNNQFIAPEMDENGTPPKFSLQLETTGPAALLVDTLQMILLSDRVAGLNLRVSIQIEQV